LTVIVIALLITMMRAIHNHYQKAAAEMATTVPLNPRDFVHTVIVPISNVNRVALQTIAYAQSIAGNVTVVHIVEDEDELEQFKADW